MNKKNTVQLTEDEQQEIYWDWFSIITYHDCLLSEGCIEKDTHEALTRKMNRIKSRIT